MTGDLIPVFNWSSNQLPFHLILEVYIITNSTNPSLVLLARFKHKSHILSWSRPHRWQSGWKERKGHISPQYQSVLMFLPQQVTQAGRVVKATPPICHQSLTEPCQTKGPCSKSTHKSCILHWTSTWHTTHVTLTPALKEHTHTITYSGQKKMSKYWQKDSLGQSKPNEVPVWYLFILMAMWLPPN